MAAKTEDFWTHIQAEVMDKAKGASGEATSCGIEHAENPCAIVIFGATGDLTARMLLPAMCRLMRYGAMPDNFAIIGASRTELSSEAFRERMRGALTEEGQEYEYLETFGDLAKRLFYCHVQFDDPSSFKGLADCLQEKDKEFGLGGNRVFYLAVPPEAYEDISRGLGEAGLSRSEGNGSFARMVVEKPFGHDLASAQKLDRVLHKSFDEDQIFRIDHYLAKETVQNIMIFRFANSIFEPMWNRDFIESVRITAVESLGVEHRAGYYDHAGVLRDMFQNHMMQLLSLSAMEPPSAFEGNMIRDEKSKVFRSLRPFSEETLARHLVLGQYTSGSIEGHKVPAYLDEPGVAADSRTPTFAAMKVFIDNWRWHGVPFYVTSGKRLAAKRTEIVVKFREVPCSMFGRQLGDQISGNTLTLGIQPREEISLTFQTKMPGPKVCLRSVLMNFDYNQGVTGPFLEAYDKVLLDCMLGDHTLFWRQDGVNLCWSFLAPALEAADSARKDDLLSFYRAGSWGPQEVRRLMEGAKG
ncbi:glucose-6-phosphate 1-dehydrogenase [Desulfovibrio sp. X2]|uniref:glucose-6-phosphate dehydrogenase n=1 Tax=Desulfovibrio sp. X2 TaxID=941449 RepID=UPI000358975C|nr:glucose-6-phosphate dehydrogenase [Desulfovibrio sp. X2]EPR44090.1 glucose-6-phosphate 1-dehydrogenase [Desulfovibrio sp. X2]